MIVPMKKVLLLAQASQKEDALKHLRDAGVMQITMTEDSSKSTDYAANTVLFARRVSEKLHRLAEESVGNAGYPDSGLDGKTLLGKSGLLIEHISAIDAELDAINARLKRLAPWGKFDRKLLEKLNSNGINAPIPYDRLKILVWQRKGRTHLHATVFRMHNIVHNGCLEYKIAMH